MARRQSTTVSGLFDDDGQAERAVVALRDAGFGDKISVAQRGERGPEVATGAAGGGIFGGLLGAVTTVAIPGIGPIVAVGLLAATLIGAATGATVGSLLGALYAHGIPEEEARVYEREIHAGKTIVTVLADDRADEAAAILGPTARTAPHP